MRASSVTCFLLPRPSEQRPTKGSNSPSLHSHEISKETGGLAGCWHHLVTGFLICISVYPSRTLGDSI